MGRGQRVWGRSFAHMVPGLVLQVWTDGDGLSAVGVDDTDGMGDSEGEREGEREGARGRRVRAVCMRARAAAHRSWNCSGGQTRISRVHWRSVPTRNSDSGSVPLAVKRTSYVSMYLRHASTPSARTGAGHGGSEHQPERRHCS